MEDELWPRMEQRLALCGVSVPTGTIAACATFISELSRWNRRINLTALPLDSPIPDATIDRLIVEPLIASTVLPCADRTWFDLGSGGGSPAIPLRTVWVKGTLTMVESRARKCAFLRDVATTMSLGGTRVIHGRVEDLEAGAQVDLVTVRAVRIDAAMAQSIRLLLAPGAKVVVFGSRMDEPWLTVDSVVALPGGSSLTTYEMTG